MIRTLVVLALLLSLAFSAAAQGKKKPWLRGTWEGVGYQTDNAETWAMQLSITRRKNRRIFSIEYPSLKCGGQWKLISMSQTKARFREQLDHGQDACDNNGLVFIERKAGQLTYLYSRRGSRELTASAILNRKKAGSAP